MASTKTKKSKLCCYVLNVLQSESTCNFVRRRAANCMLHHNIPSARGVVGWERVVLRSEIPSGMCMCTKLRTVAANNNRDHARNLSYYCLLALHI